MISRIAPYFAASALFLTASFAVAQTTAPSTSPVAPSAPPAASAPAPTDAVGSGGRQRGERREGRGAMRACRADMQSLCGTVERGKGKKIACLIENRAKASPECQTAITAVETARSGKAADKAAKRAEGGGKAGKGGRKMAVCRADSKALCADVEKGGGRKVACLKANEAKLTPDCAAMVKSLPTKG
jgi:Cysteine rich repeat